MQIHIDNTYAGPFEHVGKVGDLDQFNSAQKLTSSDTTLLHLADLKIKPSVTQNDFDFNVIDWFVDPRGKISGKAKFLSATTHDIVKATLDGEVQPQTGFKLAHVTVTFAGGTGPFARAKGTARVVAKLFENGLSVGHIAGDIET